jgi:hypothetical protein
LGAPNLGGTHGVHGERIDDGGWRVVDRDIFDERVHHCSVRSAVGIVCISEIGSPNELHAADGFQDSIAGRTVDGKHILVGKADAA